MTDKVRIKSDQFFFFKIKVKDVTRFVICAVQQSLKCLITTDLTFAWLHFPSLLWSFCIGLGWYNSEAVWQYFLILKSRILSIVLMHASTNTGSKTSDPTFTYYLVAVYLLSLSGTRQLNDQICLRHTYKWLQFQNLNIPYFQHLFKRHLLLLHPQELTKGKTLGELTYACTNNSMWSFSALQWL